MKKFLVFLFSVILLSVFVVSANAALVPLQVGMWWENDRHDSASPPNEWVARMEVLEQVTFGSQDYFLVAQWNYEPPDETYEQYLVRSTENELYVFTGTGEALIRQAAAVGTSWTYSMPDDAGGLNHAEIVSIGPVEVPHGSYALSYLHRFYFEYPGGGSSPYWYDYIVPGLGSVKEIDYKADNPPQIGELARTGTVPIPSTMLLLGSGLVGLASARRKKFKK